MANFFARQPIPLTPNPEPAGYDVLRYMLMNRAMGQMANPYGLSPQGAQNFGGFNQGSRQFNPYGQGFGPGGATPPPPGSVGGMMGGGGAGMGGGGGMPPQLMQLLQQLFSGGMGGNQGPQVSPIQAPRPAPIQQRMGTTSAPPPQMVPPTSSTQPRRIMPVMQQPGGYDGTTVGYGGNRMGTASFPHQAPPNVMSMMRAFGQVPRPRMMPPQMMGAMRMPGYRGR